ncbi:MAG: TolC family protein [Nitrospirae bacterium]|nr:TolC family protein [Candidatus Manganitrophaceae bacterium]
MPSYIQQAVCAFVVLWVLLSGEGRGFAEAPTLRLTLEDSIRLARERNFAVATARLNIAASRADRISAGLLPNPVLSLNDTFVDLQMPRNGSQVTARIDQPIETFGKRRYRIEASERAVESSDFQHRHQVRQLTLEVETTFYRILMLQKNLRLAEGSAERFAEILRVNTLRYRKGDISEAELIKIRLQQLDYQNDILSVRSEIQEQEKKLKELLVLDPSAPVELAGELEYQERRVDLENLKKEAVLSRPDMQEVESELRRVESEARLARAMRYPNVSVGMEYDTVGPDYHGMVGAGLSVSLPLFDRNQGEVRKANVRVETTRLSRQEKEHQILLDAEYAYRDFLQKRLQVLFFESQVLRDAASSREIAERAYTKGGASLLDLFDSERTYNTTQRNYHEALFQYQISLFQLDFVSGKEILR